MCHISARLLSVIPPSRSLILVFQGGWTTHIPGLTAGQMAGKYQPTLDYGRQLAANHSLTDTPSIVVGCWWMRLWNTVNDGGGFRSTKRGNSSSSTKHPCAESHLPRFGDGSKFIKGIHRHHCYHHHRYSLVSMPRFGGNQTSSLWHAMWQQADVDQWLPGWYFVVGCHICYHNNIICMYGGVCIMCVHCTCIICRHPSYMYVCHIFSL